MKDKKLQFLKFALFLGFFTFLIFSARAANAATLYFSPSSGNFTVGNILNTSVLVNTQGQAINNAGAVINFPTNFLEVISVSKSGSIFSLWVEEPSFSNSAGSISFDGGLPTPGYNGSAGRLLNITFRVRNAGTASLVFSSGAVRANDGYGTDILQTRGQAQYNLISEEKPVAPPPPVLGTLQAPGISSPTHPDPNKWYANSNPKFEWELPGDITGVNVLADKNSTTDPGTRSDGLRSSYAYTDVDDGVWYFHLRLRNAAGWGGISHLRFQIDTKPPKPFSLTFIDGKEANNPQPKISFETTDELSGINFYKIKVGDGGFVTISPESMKRGPYVLSPQTSGKRTVTVQAVDGTGNIAAASDEFIIGSLEAPKITEYPRELRSGDILTAKGTSRYPNIDIVVSLQHEEGDTQEQVVKSDRDGKFTFIAAQKVKNGVYQLWAEARDELGAKSAPSEKVTIVVGPSALFKIGAWTIEFLNILIPLIALIILLILLLWHSWYRFLRLKKKIRKEVREVESALHKSFDLLKEDIQEQVKMLERVRTKRELTREEEKILKQFKRNLNDAEQFVEEKIETIEKEVK